MAASKMLREIIGEDGSVCVCVCVCLTWFMRLASVPLWVIVRLWLQVRITL